MKRMAKHRFPSMISLVRLNIWIVSKYIEIKERRIRSLLNRSKTRQQLIEKVLDTLEFLPNIKTVSTSCETDTYTACSLKRLNCLEKISIDNKISVEDLIEICKSNTNLRVLWIREVVGELSDIVPHCQNLEEIFFPMLYGHKSYSRLTDLPKLRNVFIKSINPTSPCAKLIELFDAFAEKKQQTALESLMLFFFLSFEETSKLIQLSSLKELRCAFDDARCIDLLTDLTELEGLYIMLERTAGGCKECLNILRSCQKLQHLHINSTVSIEFTGKALEVLRQVRKPEKQKPLRFYSNGVRHLCNDKGEEEIDNEYCVVVNRSEYLRASPWRSDLYQLRHCAKRRDQPVGCYRQLGFF
ncbi:uncharacterized protein LOC133844898 [Drosophila sulfurigaster albostrigata]|uniref:uncharacterized protein LOC133844898 n=1 Tax=Drosophila sulfurigaster albostrigata TaxID=89887 RepID=UPI002D21AAB9|nr:uncharacterized protein LOC133844898 [Drosophila sulfurigaster albostrigata]